MSTKAFEGHESHEKGLHEKLFDMLLEAIPSSILIIDPEMRIASANRNFLEKSRNNRGEVIGRKLEEILPKTLVENMDIGSRVRQVFEQRQATRGERMTYRAPGVPMRIYYYSILPFVHQGIVENAILMMEDVTEQVRLDGEVRRVERHLASVIESAQDIVLSTDSDGKVLTWNTAAERLSGYSLREVEATPFLNRCAPDHHDELKAVLARLRVGTSSQTGEWDLNTKTGKRIPVSWVFSPMKDENAQLVGIVAVGRDLSERRGLEAQLLQSQKLAALGVMAGGIAHEIRNPLGICLSAAELLEQSDISPEFRKECIEKIQTNIRRASVIIENLLRFARPSSTTKMEKVEVVGLLRDTIELIVNQAKLQKVAVHLDLPENELSVHGNADLLQQVFLNLFLNAINSMPQGGDLRVSVSRTHWQVSIRIEDSGHGIPEEHLEKIFDPFYRKFPSGKGTGLGLSISYSIVKQHFGNIQVQSAEGNGAAFTVTFPLF
jgi:PAS domain S-box-containing protein